MRRARGAPDGVVAGGVDDAAYAVAHHRLEQGAGRDHVGLQRGRQRGLGRDACQVDDRVRARLRDHRVDGHRVGAVEVDVTAPAGQVGTDHLVPEGSQARGEHAADRARGAGEEDLQLPSSSLSSSASSSLSSESSPSESSALSSSELSSELVVGRRRRSCRRVVVVVVVGIAGVVVGVRVLRVLERRWLALVVVLGVRELPLLDVELPLGVVDLGVLRTVLGIEAALALLLHLLLGLLVRLLAGSEALAGLAVVLVAVAVLAVVAAALGVVLVATDHGVLLRGRRRLLLALLVGVRVGGRATAAFLAVVLVVVAHLGPSNGPVCLIDIGRPKACQRAFDGRTPIRCAG